MAKTVFTDGNPSLEILGTPVMAAFLNLIFNHVHDGEDNDGHAPVDQNWAVKVATDPDTSGWGTDEAPYFWFNTTDKKLKMWNGEEIVLLG